MQHIENNGTVLIWTQHENTILRDIAEQMEKYGHQDETLKNWIQLLARSSKDEEEHMLDMNKLANRYYFHPEMKGSTSIKYVLPAIWKNNAFLYDIPWFKPYVKYENSKIQDLYAALPSMEIMGGEEVKKELVPCAHIKR